MAKKRPEDELGELKVEYEVDSRGNPIRRIVTFPAGPVPEPVRGPTFLQRHPYLGPIIAAIISVVVMGTITIVLWILSRPTN